MKLLVITGASRGIGLGTAALFRDHGYRVVNISRHRGGFEHGTWIAADLAEPAWLERVGAALVDEAQHAGEIVIVHNAATLQQDSLEKSCDSDILQMLQVNVLAQIQLNRLLLPYMDEGSAIIYVGSALSERGAPRHLSYTVSKHAQIGLMRSSAVELADRGMHAVCVCPGLTDNELARRHFGSDTIEQFVLQDMLLQRALNPDDAARLIFFCATTPSINGAVIHANLNRSPAPE